MLSASHHIALGDLLGALCYFLGCCGFLDLLWGLLRGPSPIGVEQSPLSHKAVDGSLDPGFVLLHIVVSSSQSLLEGGSRHSAPLLGCCHSLNDQLTDAGIGLLHLIGLPL